MPEASDHPDASDDSAATAVPALLGHTEMPSSRHVTRHNFCTIRFAGWVASTRGRPAFVRVQERGRPERRIPPSVARPDVLNRLGAEYGVTDPMIGFQFYLELPKRPWWDPPEITVELTDGEVGIPADVYRFFPPVDGILETYDNHSAAKHALAARWLEGRGVEFGALHQPLQVDTARAKVLYADRLTKAEAIAAFPDITEHFAEAMVEPDFIVDLNTGDLSSLAGEGLDFFIANDVIEHLANPLRFLRSVHDVMKPGARLFLSVPDRRCTHDADRPLTSMRHLWREYRRGVTTISDRHVRRYLVGAEHERIPWSPTARRALYDWHRERSFHVHVWDNDSFDRMLELACTRIPLQLRVVDRASAYEGGGAMIYVLERT